MEPKFEPKQHTQEEIAQLEKSRTISDAELLEGGAEYVVGEKGEKENLLATEKQKDALIENYEDKKRNEEIMQSVLRKLESNDKKIGSYISLEKIKMGRFEKPYKGELINVHPGGVVIDRNRDQDFTLAEEQWLETIPLEDINIESIS